MELMETKWFKYRDTMIRRNKDGDLERISIEDFDKMPIVDLVRKPVEVVAQKPIEDLERKPVEDLPKKRKRTELIIFPENDVINEFLPISETHVRDPNIIELHRVNYLKIRAEMIAERYEIIQSILPMTFMVDVHGEKYVGKGFNGENKPHLVIKAIDGHLNITEIDVTLANRHKRSFTSIYEAFRYALTIFDPIQIANFKNRNRNPEPWNDTRLVSPKPRRESKVRLADIIPLCYTDCRGSIKGIDQEMLQVNPLSINNFWEKRFRRNKRIFSNSPSDEQSKNDTLPNAAESSCGICFDTYDKESRFPSTLVGCFHCFCSSCAAKFEKKICPVCNQKFSHVQKLFFA